MKKSLIFTVFLLLSFRSIDLLASDSDERLTVIKRICRGTFSLSANPETTAMAFKTLSKGLSYNDAKNADLLNLALDSGQYLLFKILLEKFPAFVIEKGLLIKPYDEQDEAHLNSLKKRYFNQIVKEYLEAKSNYFNNHSYENFWELEAKKEVIYRIALQLNLKANRFIKMHSPKSTLNPNAAIFEPSSACAKDAIFFEIFSLFSTFTLNEKATRAKKLPKIHSERL